MIPAIEEFVKNLKSIEESDYGDFMRKANLYFIDLKAQIEMKLAARGQRKLEEIQDYLQFKPDWNISHCLSRLLQDLEILNQEIEGGVLKKASESPEFYPLLHP